MVKHNLRDSTWPQHAMHLANRAHRVRRVMQNAVGVNHVERFRSKRQPLAIGNHERTIGAVQGEPVACDLNGARREIDARAIRPTTRELQQVEIILRRGLLGGEFLRGRSAEEIMSRVIEFSDHGARPLVKVYSRRQTRALFSMFREVVIDIEQLTRAELRFLSPLVSERMFERLRKRIGWNVIVTATK